MGLTVTNSVNFVQFDAVFSGTNTAEGLLSVYWNSNQIGIVDQRVSLTATQKYQLLLPITETNGLHVFGFRLDSFNGTSSSITITNVTTGFTGPIQPTHLKMLCFTNGTPILSLNGPANYNYVVESSTNLLDWRPTAVLVNSNGTSYFADPNTLGSGTRFYRATLP
jgi:hypothetical protein